MLSQYSRSTIMAALAATGLTTVHSLLSGGRSFMWVSLIEIPEMFSLLLPLAAIAGGISAARRSEGPQGLSARLRAMWAIAGGVGILSFLVTAFIAPWMAEGLSRLLPSAASAGLSSSHTILGWGAEYRHLLGERVAGEPMLGWTIAVAGLHFYQPIVGALMAALLTLFGFLVGTVTADMPPRVARVHHWAAALMSIGAVAACGSLALTMTVEHGMLPATALLMMLVPPASLVSALMWSESTAAARIGSATPA